MADSYLSLSGLTYYDSIMKSRIREKLGAYSGTTAEWSAKTSLVSEKDVLYIYTDHTTTTVNGDTINIPGIKIGDGQAYVVDLPFVAVDEPTFAAHVNDNVRHVTQAEREFWNNKERSFIDPNNTETLVLTNM